VRIARWSFTLFCVAATPAVADYLDTIGYRDIQARYGTNLASGARVIVAQVEGTEAGTNYVANTNNYPTKTFNFVSGPSGVSQHASDVGSLFYGPNSVAPGITNILAYEAGGFVWPDCLRSGTNSLVPPLSPAPARVLNHSWAYALDPESDDDVLRRTDHLIATYGVTMAAGINNGIGPLNTPWLSQAYNVIAVGISSGDSQSGPTTATVAGRAKPDIVAPQGFTSYGTPLVSGSAAILIDRALSLPSLTNAADPRIVKALLLAAAAKPLGWHKGDAATSDDSAVPLDWRYGAGDLRINRAYDLLNAGEIAPGTLVTNSAWDLGTITAGNTNWYFFSLDPSRHGSLKATLVWHRHVEYKKQGPFNLTVTVSTQNLDLALFTASGTTPLSPVAFSTSAIDNVEHLWITNFTAGTYALGVTGNGAETYGLAFDATPAPLVSISGDDINAAEFGTDTAAFTIRRDGSTELAVTVNLSASGTASNGLDYTMPSSITLAAGQTNASFVLTPLLDAMAEGPETATIAIAPGVGYAISATNEATALIADRPVDSWRFENFTPAELADASISDDAADPDGDGPNLIEYDNGGLPKVFQQENLAHATIITDGGAEYLSLTFRRHTPPSDVTNIVELSSNLIDWAADSVQVGPPLSVSNGTETVIFRDTVPVTDASRRFIRRRVDRLVAP